MNPIYVIRHAEPTDCSRHVGSHWVDCALTKLGRRQADYLAARLQKDIGQTPCRIISSDLRRARQTAEPIAHELGLDIQTTPELREYHNGFIANCTGEEVKRYVREGTQATRDLLANPDPETGEHFHERVKNYLERLCTDGDGRLTLIFGHYGVTLTILAWWLQLPCAKNNDTGISFAADLASIAVLRLNRAKTKRILERVNDTSHLYAAALAQPLPIEG